MATGRNNWLRGPTSAFAICGATNPTKAMPPVTETAEAANATAVNNNTMRSFSIDTPTPTGELNDISIDEVVINHGYDRDTSLLQNSNLKIDMIDDYYIAGNATSESSVAGLYTAGDIKMQLML